MDELETRKALPEALRVLLEDYPREGWEAHPQFHGLTSYWLERHLGFRRLLPLLQDRARAIVERDAEPEPQMVVRLAGTLLNDLHGHHQVEDHHYFPLLAQTEPRLEQGFALLDADHHTLDAHLHALADHTNAVLRALAENQPPRETAARLEEALTPFAGFLDRHLSDEEDLVVPIILHRGVSF